MSALGVRWYLFGAQAALLRGSRRLTADVDVTVFIGHMETAEFVRRMTEWGFSLRVQNTTDFIKRTRVVPFTYDPTAMPVDVVLGTAGLEAHFLEACDFIDIAGVVVPTPTAEHLLVMKLLAGRDKDLEDAAAIARAAQPDLAVVESTLADIAAALGEDDSLRSLAALKRMLEEG